MTSCGFFLGGIYSLLPQTFHHITDLQHLIAGGEALYTQKNAMRKNISLNWNENHKNKNFDSW